MASNLVIVESPAKAKTIEKFLGKDFLVLSSYGHIRDLNKKDLSIDIENNFTPIYVVSKDKKKVIDELIKASKEADIIWLASDEDREGEAIAWHLKETLKLDDKKTKRIVFHEITKPAILKAIENPRNIDVNLVDAQQARRILDRLVGFELSPVLWKKVKPSLSAGRVQSVAVRLIVERDKEIKDFKVNSSFKVIGIFKHTDFSQEIKAELSKKFENKKDAITFLQNSINSEYKVKHIEKKPAKQSPAAPFITSTLQQEAARKLGFPVARTMIVAQQLYEAGLITYMRTDSVNLSESAIDMAKSEIQNLYGAEYFQMRKYANKVKGAQEAHEAIRPTYMNNHTIDADSSSRKLYDLIWKRTIASLMSDAILERTTIDIEPIGQKEMFVAKGEVIKFDGFLKVYLESSDDENIETEITHLPNISVNQKLDADNIVAKQIFSQSPPRYSEASLVKKLEDLGIGRPSTYAPTISTIIKREYVVKEDRIGEIRSYDLMTLKNGKIKEDTKTEKTGVEKGKLFPTDIGTLVNDFLVENFGGVIEYNFTANVEKDFDNIASGKKKWQDMIGEFYKPFHAHIGEVVENKERPKYVRELGIDPKSGKNVIVRMGRFGPVAQIGEAEGEIKPKFASLAKTQRIDSITLEEALDLFQLPKEVGEYEGEKMIVAIGKFGPYVKHNNKFYSITKKYDALSLTTEEAIEIIEAKLKGFIEKEFNYNGKVITLKQGRFGPYLSDGENNFKIPRTYNIPELSQDDCIEIVVNAELKKTTEPTTTTNSKWKKGKK
ncbi:MAG: DNA topoisomerase I [Bacteroidetes bacterium GWF2_29_10]|nr:MAG: DNA topoisomerase I [Bacteroidetes bacterium GWF2_29_10]